ncbi:serine/threonine-protein kinase [Microbispora sp. H10670]|uniref:serine/threonine-protein kinase n=1 Tax=Microbispora sp. H10670 TaxID=2729108 RepID=UPI002175AD97|nr:serine/threonine-protein kinase [Microbispora sp. H10670]
MIAPLEADDPRTLGGYRLGGRLGEGGQGVVYLGHGPDGDPVAVKVLKTGLDPVVRERLARELDAMRGVAPFCTARVIAAVVEGSRPYVVSEFVDGPSLQQRVAASGPLRGGDLDRLAVGTATALAAIHAAGIVHRDFKPGNVLLGPDGPRVVDFGIARQGESQTITAGPVGTPAYLAPEQIAGQPATPASDVFAWGATIVFAATGRAAFGADNVAAVLHRIMTAFPDLTALPPSLRALVERCLAKDPAARPTARDLLLTLVGSAPDPLRAGAAAGAAPAAAGGDSYGTLPRPPYGAPEPGAAGSGVAGSGAAGSGAAVTSPGGAARGGSRARVLAGAAAVVAALGITAAVLVPRLNAAPDGTSPSASADPPPTSGTTATSAPDTSATGTYGTGAEATASPGSGSTPSSSLATTTTVAIPAAFAGKWQGHIAPDTPLMGEYDIEIELRRGEKTGRWKEPANSCEGTLRLTGGLAGGSGPALTFRLEDVDGCVPGDVVLTRKGDALAYRHSDDAKLFTYTGDLTRDS